LSSIDVVHTGSENLLQSWRERIESVLGVPVKDHYGMAERVGLFHQCSESDAYHENPEYGVVELLETDYGRSREVVGTCLWNYAMPLIRYRMGDKASINENNHTCSCGRGLPLRVGKFEGRDDDILRTPDGRMLPGVNFYTLMHQIDGVEIFRIVQRAIDEINIDLVVSQEFDEDCERELHSGLRKRIGEEVTITIEYTDMIERDEQSGKIRCIESELE
jgi:phenylacetate-CoA ligase